MACEELFGARGGREWCVSHQLLGPAGKPCMTVFVAHWFSSLAVQALYQHRYAAHRMYDLSPGAAKAFHLLAILGPGPSHLNAGPTPSCTACITPTATRSATPTAPCATGRCWA